MDYEKKYKEALSRAKSFELPEYKNIAESIFPELKESEDEKIRKQIIQHIKQGKGYDLIPEGCYEPWIAWLEKQGKSSDQIHYWTEEEIEPIISDYLRGVEHYGGMIGRLRCLKPKSLEKQGSSSVKWQKNTPHNKPAIKHSVLMKTTQGIAEGEWQGEDWFQYRWSWTLKESNVLAWMELSDLDKQNEQKPTSDIKYEVSVGGSLIIVNDKPFDYEHATITQKDFASVGETATIELSSPIDCGDRIYHVSHKPIEKNGEQKPVIDFKAKNWYVSKVDGKIHDMTYNPANKVESKVGEKIEDEIEIPFGAKDSELQEETYYIPKGFHAEIDDDKIVIKKGEKFAAWSDEDEERIKNTLSVLDVQVCWDGATEKKGNPYQKEIDWLKSIKERIIWKPSKKQMETLEYYMHTLLATEHKEVLFGLYNDLKIL